MLNILPIPVLTDNYIYLLHDEQSGETAAIDPALAEPVIQVLQHHGWQLTYILNTHHHSDHVGGNLALKRQTGCKIMASLADKHRIPDIDQGVQDGDVFYLGQHRVHVIATAGHTHGHVVYYFAEDNALFSGDTLFVMGCGRLFEGSAEQLCQSLATLKALPPETRVYCAHEYSLANGRFALSVEEDNEVLQEKVRRVEQLRAENLPTVPSTIAEERATNPFFRQHSLTIQNSLNSVGESDVDVFRKLRQLKDNF